MSKQPYPVAHSLPPCQSLELAGATAAPSAPKAAASHASPDAKLLDLGRRWGLRPPVLPDARRGRTMLDELAGQLQRLGAPIADVADALKLTAARKFGMRWSRAFNCCPSVSQRNFRLQWGWTEPGPAGMFFAVDRTWNWSTACLRNSLRPN